MQFRKRFFALQMEPEVQWKNLTPETSSHHRRQSLFPLDKRNVSRFTFAGFFAVWNNLCPSKAVKPMMKLFLSSFKIVERHVTAS